MGLNDDGHIFVCAGTRSGKGVSLVVPNLTYWQGSVFVIDPKGENAVLTARRRGNGSNYTLGLKQKTIILDPFNDVHTDEDDFSDLKGSFNPLDLMKDNPDRAIDYAAKIADSVIDRTGSSDPFWPEAAHGLIKGIILHVASSKDFKDDERNLVTVRRLIFEGYRDLQRKLQDLDPDSSFTAYDLLFRAMEDNSSYDGETSLAGARFARSMFENPRMMESIAAIANTNLEFIGSPEMKKCVRSSSFKLSELKESFDGLSLYLCLPQYMMETHFRFLRMMVSLMMAEMMRIKYKPKSGYPILCVLDEFAGLKRMPVIEQSCAQIAGSGVKMMFIVQDLGQLKDIYKENWQTFMGNADTRIFFGNTAPFDKEMISKMAGQLEVKRQTATSSQSQGSSKNYGRNRNEGSGISVTHGSSSTMSSGGADGFAFSSTYSNSVTHSTNQSEGHNSSFGTNNSNTSGENEGVHLRHLITPDEVERYFADDEDPLMIIFTKGKHPLAVRRIQYYSDKNFTGKVDPHPDHQKPPTLLQLYRQLVWEEEQERLKAEAQERERKEQARIEADRKFREEVQRKNKEMGRSLARAYQEKMRKKWGWWWWIRDTILLPLVWPAFYIASIISGLVVSRGIIFVLESLGY